MNALTKVATLVLSHTLVVVVSAFAAIHLYGDRHLSAMHRDPRYQLGLFLDEQGKAPAGGLPPLPSVIRDMELQYETEPVGISRLICELLGIERGGELQLGTARASCEKLGLGRCDAQQLRAMRGVLLQ